jgi:type II secretory pathway pseudopilin PulG
MKDILIAILALLATINLLSAVNTYQEVNERAIRAQIEAVSNQITNDRVNDELSNLNDAELTAILGL